VRNITPFIIAVILLLAMPFAAVSAAPLDEESNAACQQEFYEQMSARARLQGQRDYEAATTLIFKPDSTLEYSCFAQPAAAAKVYMNRMPGALGNNLNAESLVDTLLSTVVDAVQEILDEVLEEAIQKAIDTMAEAIMSSYGGSSYSSLAELANMASRVEQILNALGEEDGAEAAGGLSDLADASSTNGGAAGAIGGFIGGIVQDVIGEMMGSITDALAGALGSRMQALAEPLLRDVIDEMLPEGLSELAQTELSGVESLVENSLSNYVSDAFPHGYLGGAIPGNDLCKPMNEIFNVAKCMNRPGQDMFVSMREWVAGSGMRTVMCELGTNNFETFSALQLAGNGAPEFTPNFTDAEDSVDAADTEIIGPFGQGVEGIENMVVTEELRSMQLHCREQGVDGWAASHVPYAELDVGEPPYEYGDSLSGKLWMMVPKSEVGGGAGHYSVAVDQIGMNNGGLQSFANVYCDEVDYEAGHRCAVQESALENWTPRPGNQYGFMMTIGNGGERTNIITETWPDCGDAGSGSSGPPGGTYGDISAIGSGIGLIALATSSYSQPVFSDSLQGSTQGHVAGGRFTDEGYSPGKGESHILFNLPRTIKTGAVEFEVKGMTNNTPDDTDHGFFAQYDGRGVSEPADYFSEYKENYFRWNVHYRQNRQAMKGVVNNAFPTRYRQLSRTAIFENGIRDWTAEPTGRQVNWDPNRWYKMRIEWGGGSYSVKIDGRQVWSLTSPQPYAPIDHRMRLGSGPGKYSSEVNDIVYRNFNVYDFGG